LIEDVVEVGPVASLAVIAVAFTIGIVLSLRADRRDPGAGERRRERADSMRQRGEVELEPSADGTDGHQAPAERAPR
jgi:hypothetical protein